jgi:hypothetical protein
MSENQQNQNQQPSENVHAATDPEKCEEMAERYNWELREVRPTSDPILKVDCVFEGEQTSFEDTRYDK